MIFKSDNVVLFKVTEEDIRPAGEEHPNDAAHDELVDWLADLEQDWDADPFGMNFNQDELGGTGPAYIHLPGDYVLGVKITLAKRSMWIFRRVIAPVLPLAADQSVV